MCCLKTVCLSFIVKDEQRGSQPRSDFMESKGSAKVTWKRNFWHSRVCLQGVLLKRNSF